MIKCKVCGKAFEKEHPNQKYCSSECAYKAKIEQGKRYRRKHREEINRRQQENWYQKMKACIAEHDNCFSCPTKDGECLYG